MRFVPPNTVGGRIRQLRMLRQMKMAHLADLVGVSMVSVCYWETNAKPVPAKRHAALAAALGVTVEDLQPQPEAPVLTAEEASVIAALRSVEQDRRDVLMVEIIGLVADCTQGRAAA